MFPILKKYISNEFKNSRYCPDDLKVNHQSTLIVAKSSAQHFQHANKKKKRNNFLPNHLNDKKPNC